MNRDGQADTLRMLALIDMSRDGRADPSEPLPDCPFCNGELWCTRSHAGRLFGCYACEFRLTLPDGK